MAPVAPLLAALLLASAACASPVVTIDQPLVKVPFTKRINGLNLKGIAQRDRARAAHFKTFGNTRKFNNNAVVGVPATSEAVTYVANVAVGNPSTNFQLIIDTGSSNTWVGSGTAFKKTSTSKDTGHEFAVSYGSGDVFGEEFLDRVSLAPGLVIAQQSIGVASQSDGFGGVDGILGIGPVALTDGTQQDGSLVPTVTDNLFSSKAISSNVVSVSFAPANSAPLTNGELTFGGTDSSRFSGSIKFQALTRTSPASEFWGIDQTVTLGTRSILASTAGIVDTGTTLILLATNAFKLYQSATGAVLDRNTGLLRVTQAQFNALPNLNFNIGGTTFALTANGQIWPRALNTEIGGTAGQIFLIVNDLGSNSGQGLDFINGQGFLERFYTEYDTTNRRIGFATTPFTNSTSN